MRSYYIKARALKKIAFCFAVLILCGLAVAVQTGPLQQSSVDADTPAPIYHGSEQGKNLSFAINVDWGEEFIPAMLDIFAANNMQVTWFLTGRWCEKNPDLAQEIVARGHEIGNHAYSHKSPNSMSKEQNAEEITKTTAAIEAATGVVTTLYAPPSGECEKQVLQAAAACGNRVILWSVDTIDWQKPEPEVIINRVLKKAAPGAIVLMHPTANTLAALPALIDDLCKQGYTLVNVSTNIAAGVVSSK